MQKDEMVQASVELAANDGSVTLSLVERLRAGCVEHARRWSGDTHTDLGGSVNEAATDDLMREAAAEIERLRAVNVPGGQWPRSALLELAIRLEERGEMHRLTVQTGGLGFYGAGDGQLDIDAASAIREILAAPFPPRPGERTDGGEAQDGRLNQTSINASPKPEGE